MFYLGLMMAIAVIAWVGQWGRRSNIARYAVLILIGITGFLLMAAGGLVVWASRTGSILVPMNLGVVGWLLVLMGGAAIPSLIPPVRRLLRKTVFSGLEVDVPAHTWALYIYLVSLVVTIISITLLYDPDVIIESLKSMPLIMTAVVNAVSFVLFAFIASGIWIYKSPKDVAVDLGITRLPWKTVGLMVGVALALAIGIQGLEWLLMPLVNADMMDALRRVVDALKPAGGPQETLVNAVIVGLGAGIGEETLFRGLIQPVFGIIPTALLFTLIHTHYGPTVLLLELFIVGVILGIIRKRYNTTAAIIVHAGFDFFALASSLLHP